MKPLKRHEANHVWRGSGRCYSVDGQTLPGITTVLDATKSNADRDGLRRWRERVGDAEADRIRDEALARGTAVHEAIEARLLNTDAPELAEDHAKFFASVTDFLDRVSDVHLIEGAVWSPRGYAGTCDALLTVDGELTLVDWKTANRPKTGAYITDYKLQAAAYCGALNHVYAADGVRVNHAKIVVALANQPAQVFDIAPSDMMRHWRAWLRRLVKYSQAEVNAA